MTESISKEQKPVGMRFILSALALLLASQAFAEDGSPTTIQIKSVDRCLTRSLKDFLRREANPPTSLSVKKIVKWDFEKKSGEFLLVEAKTASLTACILYIKDRGVYRSLGGNDHCSWKKSPKLVWKDEFAWIEFPTSPHGRTTTPVAHNELTAHFDKASGGICMLGLPAIGFDGLRCPNDEAPASK